MNRYSNQQKITGFTPEHQMKLDKAKVLVVGAGGLGCPLLTNLIQMGVGHVTILDDDVVNESNLNRQWLYTPNDVGEPKVVCAEQRLLKLNPSIKIKGIQDRLTSKNAKALVQGFDVAVDCTDNLAARYALDEGCHLFELPLVFGGIRMTEGQVGIFNGASGVRFSDVFKPTKEAFRQEDCNTLGTLGFICNMVGSFQASEVFKIITGLGEPLMAKVVHLDAFGNSVSSFNYAT